MKEIGIGGNCGGLGEGKGPGRGGGGSGRGVVAEEAEEAGEEEVRAVDGQREMTLQGRHGGNS